MGHPKTKVEPIKRKYQLEEMINIDKFYRKTPIKISEESFIIKKNLYKIYRYTPLWLKKLFLNKLTDKKFVKKFKN